MIYLQVREDFAVEHRVCYAQEILHGVIPIPVLDQREGVLAEGLDEHSPLLGVAEADAGLQHAAAIPRVVAIFRSNVFCSA